MQLIFNSPMLAYRQVGFFGSHPFAADILSGICSHFAGIGNFRH